MSNLIKPYEISVWEDVWDNEKEKFVEKKVCTIGTNQSLSQSRALEPVLTRNVNGTKRLSFKMYKKYIDTETGEETKNPFIDFLVSERKVKLYYENRWYDFVIKNISETSTDYLYNFDLEDALVQELSKNGFGVTLDAQLNNNMGTANELISYVLKDTDWTVGDCDKLVQEVKEHLVYVSLVEGNRTIENAYQLKNSSETYDQDGVLEIGPQTIVLQSGDKLMAFYSSCTGKPHRFQFLVIREGEAIVTNEDNIILNKDSQYYIECEPQDYIDESVDNTSKSYGFVLPVGWCTQEQGNLGEDSTVSSKYRGNRFGYAQQAVYLPKLDRYVNKYSHSNYKNTDGSSQLIYGYSENEYISPVLITNLISNSDFKNSSGWKGIAYYEKEGAFSGTKPDSSNKPTVENVYGRFQSGDFISAMDELNRGQFSAATTYTPYMKLDFTNIKKSVNQTFSPAIINNGPFDNRVMLKQIAEGEEWVLYVQDKNNKWPENLFFELEESEFVASSGCYHKRKNGLIAVSTPILDSQENIFGMVYKFPTTQYNEKTFRKEMQLRLKITGSGVHYIQNIELHRVVRDKQGNIIRLSQQADNINEGIVNYTYYYFTEEEYNKATTKEDISYIHVAKEAEPFVFNPLYNTNAEKIRSVTVKESNYFNILQSIAETFEAWLDLDIQRDVFGSPIAKTVRLKKYAGGDNYAAFRYGVNLKSIERTIESKQIVTKLIVKNNSNELAKNKFCTIQRAPSNISGENYIYDFQYFHNMGLLGADDYLNELYFMEGAIGQDIDPTHDNTNLKGYFPRIKLINNRLTTLSEEITGLSQELLQLKAEREVATATQEAAISGIEQISEDFFTLTGFGIDAYTVKDVTNSNLVSWTSQWPLGGNSIAPGPEARTFFMSENGSDCSISLFTINKAGLTYNITLTRTNQRKTERTVNATLYIPMLIEDGGEGIWTYQGIELVFKFPSEGASSEDYTKATVQGTFNAINTDRSDVKKLLAEYITYQQELQKAEKDLSTLSLLIDGEGETIGKQQLYNQKNSEIEQLRDIQKATLNRLFYQKYARFIQEGTWMDEQYIDDEKYYNDAQTVLYNSCYPKVAYTINVLSLGQLPGYEYFKFNVGEKTYVEDPEFFGLDSEGYPIKTEIIITEMTEHLDSPQSDQISVQNFKNQFQDLFQKITATVQTAQYNEGTYKKGAALVESSSAKKNAFMLDALSDPNSVLSNAGQNEVVWDNSGITVTNKNNKSEQLRLVSSGIMFSSETEGGVRWSTGITPQGISADRILAGQINTGEICLMNGKDSTFLWNAFGINAFSIGTIEEGVASKISKDKFVRFDRFGIYGINGTANAENWTPKNEQEIDQKATFALTWEGLKVTGNENAVARIGKQGDSIIKVTQGSKETFVVDNEGNVTIRGNVIIGDSEEDSIENYIGGKLDASSDGGSFNWSFDKDTGLFMYKGAKEVFAINSQDGLVMHGSGEFTGKIIAESGEIGNWQIKDNFLMDEYEKVGLYSGDDWPMDSLVSSGSSSTVRFFAGRQSTGGGNGESGATATFAVLEDGSVYMEAGTLGSGTELRNSSGKSLSFDEFIQKHNDLDEAIGQYVTSDLDSAYQSAKITFEDLTVEAEEGDK